MPCLQGFCVILDKICCATLLQYNIFALQHYCFYTTHCIYIFTFVYNYIAQFCTMLLDKYSQLVFVLYTYKWLNIYIYLFKIIQQLVCFILNTNLLDNIGFICTIYFVFTQSVCFSGFLAYFIYNIAQSCIYRKKITLQHIVFTCIYTTCIVSDTKACCSFIDYSIVQILFLYPSFFT